MNRVTLAAAVAAAATLALSGCEHDEPAGGEPAVCYDRAGSPVPCIVEQPEIDIDLHVPSGGGRPTVARPPTVRNPPPRQPVKPPTAQQPRPPAPPKPAPSPRR